MKLVKLDATDSTNDYLKNLVRNETVENFTVVSAEFQSKGRGQMGAEWRSDKGKNLIISILVKGFIVDATAVFDLNIAFALAVFDALEKVRLPNLSIKWPNDIMAGTKKIGGILIENSFRGDGNIYSIVGLGLNVNQIQFENLPTASSIAAITGHELDRFALLHDIVNRLESYCDQWKATADQMTELYTNLLFKKDERVVFSRANQSHFYGRIRGISKTGKLIIEEENELQQEYDIKEVKMIF